MWAPWRMEYILGSKQGACIFCDFAAASPQAFRDKHVLLVQPHAVLCLNAYPFAAGHVLVAPRRHVASPGELPVPEYDALMRLVREVTTRLQGGTGADGMNVGLNLGKSAGAGIADHLHVHVVPRWNGDSNFMPVLADVRVMPEHLDATWARLEPLFADLPGVHPEATEPGA